MACVCPVRLDGFPPSVGVSRTFRTEAAELSNLDTGGGPHPTETTIPDLAIRWRKEKVSREIKCRFLWETEFSVAENQGVGKQ